MIVEYENEISGFCICELHLNRIILLRMCVLPQNRKKGIGKALLEKIKTKITKKRKTISAEVRETNLSIQLFLKSQHYKAVKVLRNYFLDTEEDAFVFQYNN